MSLPTPILKKLLAICFLVLFLFNVGGYYLVFMGLNANANQALSKKIDNDNLRDQQTFLIKIPVTLPYPINDSYERAHGEFEYNGEYYRLVKQKFSNDTIHMVCVKNDRKNHLNTVLVEYSKKSNDLDGATTPNLLSKIYHDFSVNELIHIIEGNAWYTINLFAVLSFPTCDQLDHVEILPPEAIS